MKYPGVVAAALLLVAGFSGCLQPAEVVDTAGSEWPGSYEPLPEETGEENQTQASELFENALPDLELPENPFYEAAIREEISQVIAACQESYTSMEREEDLLGRIFRPSYEQLEHVADIIGGLGYTVVGKPGTGVNMQNSGTLLEFYNQAISGGEAETGVYHIDSIGEIVRISLLAREGEIYHSRVGFGWNLDMTPYINDIDIITMLDYFFLTDKGYLMYGSEKDGFARTAGGLRVEPLGKESKQLADAYLAPLQGYTGHNVLLDNWNAQELEKVNFNDVFDMLYRHYTGDDPWKIFTRSYDETKPYIHAVPAEEFETVITAYFPITAEKLRETASFDQKQNCYPWATFTASGFPVDWEVVEYTYNSDGTITLVVDAIYINKGMDHIATNTLSVRPNGNGGFQYLSNTVEYNEAYRNLLPPHHHRIRAGDES